MSSEIDRSPDSGFLMLPIKKRFELRQIPTKCNTTVKDGSFAAQRQTTKAVDSASYVSEAESDTTATWGQSISELFSFSPAENTSTYS